MILGENINKEELIKLLDKELDFGATLLQFDNDIESFLLNKVYYRSFTLKTDSVIKNLYVIINENGDTYYVRKELCTDSRSIRLNRQTYIKIYGLEKYN